VASEVKGTKEQYKELDDNWKAWDAANTAKVDEKKAEVEEINQLRTFAATYSLRISFLLFILASFFIADVAIPRCALPLCLESIASFNLLLGLSS